MARKDVVAGLITNNGMILIAQRSCSALNGKWEFPGGKVEGRETHEAALYREIQEELGVKIRVGQKIATNDFQVGHRKYCLHCYSAEILYGSPVAGEHYSIAWVSPKDLLKYDLAPADIPIAEKLTQEYLANVR